MPTLELKRDIGFFLTGITDSADRDKILADLQSLIGQHKTEFANYDDFARHIPQNFWERHFSERTVLAQARKFFGEVVDCRVTERGDAIYSLRAADAQPTAIEISTYVFVNYNRDESGNVALIKSVQEYLPALAYEAAKRLTHMSPQDVERLNVVQEKNHASDETMIVAVHEFLELNPDQIAEAVDWYLSEELRWMDNHERLTPETKERNRQDKIGIIKSSFDESTVVQKEDKLRSYFERHKTAYRGHRKIAYDYLQRTCLAQKCVSENVDINKVVDMIMLIIIVESTGNPNAKKGAFMGLMQLSKEKFDEYGGEANAYFDPKTNIETGSNYLLKYCFGEARNPNRDYSRAFINYNMGAGAAGRYRAGEMPLEKSEAAPYIRDYIIYERIKARYFPENVIYGEY